MLPSTTVAGHASRRWFWLIPIFITALLIGAGIVYMRPPTAEQQAEADHQAFEASFLQSCAASASSGQELPAERVAWVQRYCQCTLNEFNAMLKAKRLLLADLLPSMSGDMTPNPEMKEELISIGTICLKQLGNP